MVCLFILSVAAIVLAVDLVAAGVYLWVADLPPQVRPSLQLVPGVVYAGAALLTVLVIGAVSIVNIVRLAEGGAKLARMVAARPVAGDTQDPLERRLLNIVEEMSIASGVRVPQVFVMDAERGINAFAAGWSVSGSVVAVTRGTLERLTRDELQGVVAHEFSHILNGDMALNIRMIGVLAGIVALGSIGEFLMRVGRDSDDLRSGAPLFVGGLALLAIGYIGLFFARLIKAAVSRQREFLADASAVQFTRNPDGIAGALDQIAESGAGTLIQARYAEEMSHMFFGQSVRMHLADLFDTHPPLGERIRRVHPQFLKYDYRKRRSASVPAPEPAAPAAEATVPPAGRRAADLGTAWGRSASQSLALVGALDANKVDYAGRLIDRLPAGLRESLRTADGACAALLALLLAPKAEVMQQQLDAMKASGLGEMAARAAAASGLTRNLSPAFHLPVIDLALPAVKSASDETKKELLLGIEAVIHADRRVSLHEFVVLTLVRHQLGAAERAPRTTARLAELRDHVAVVLSLVAHAGTRADAAGSRAEGLQKAMQAGADTIGDITLPQLHSLSFDQANGALVALKALAPLQKAVLIKGLFAAVTADGVIRVAEAELMRLVGAVLDCPLPPLLQELDPASLEA
ncbi:MAG TPA: M48 family metallopeptidase [Burkholderiales bacterium]|nr:M48 family metallopeptidase [Burkholderiales bacterium]